MYGSSYFTEKDFACRCGCGFGSKESDISQDLVHALVGMRLLVNRAIVINSGARCPDYNTVLGGKPNSAHLRDEFGQCRAADIQATNSKDRKEIMEAAMRWGIKRIGIAQSFVHIDVAVGGPYPPSYWLY